MRGLSRALVALYALFAVSAVWSTDTEIKIDGQIRVRAEADKRSFAPDEAVTSFGLLRTRVSVEAIVDGNAHAFVQFQDSRKLGGYTFTGDRASGLLNDGKNVDIHQAYIQVDNLLGKGWGGRAGRFEVNLGNQRVFGAVGWHNVGRAWEGAMGWYDHAEYTFTLYSLKALEMDDSTYNRDFEIIGLYAGFKDLDLDLYGFYEYDADSNSCVTNKLDRITLGAYGKRRYRQFDFELNGALQLGNMPAGMLPDTTELDISAFMFALEAGYSFASAGHPRVAAGVDYSSGDGDMSDDKYKSYDNLYYTGHKFRGYMDYFIPSETAGLMDIVVRGRIDPIRGWTVKSDFHFFAMAQDYTDFNGEATKDVGVEIDLTVTTTRIRGVTMLWGGSVFVPKDSFAGTADNESSYWLYTMSTVDF